MLIHIHVHEINGRKLKYDLEVNGKDSLNILMMDLQEKTNSTYYFLFHKGKELNLNMTFDDCDIQDGSTIVATPDADFAKGGGLGPRRWISKTDRGEVMIHRSLRMETTVKNLRKSISEQIDTPLEKLKFVFDGIELEDIKTIGELGIEEPDIENYGIKLEPMYNASGEKTGFKLVLERQ